MKKKQKSGVEIVRQKGGDCLESVRQRVRVVREADAGGVMDFVIPDGLRSRPIRNLDASLYL